MTPTRQSKAGFTLIEVVVALTLLVVSLLAVGSAVLGAAQLGKSARERTAALNVARSELEVCHTLKFSNSYLDKGTYTFVRGGYSGTRLIDEEKIVASPTQTTFATNIMKRITVRVAYPSSWGRTANVELRGVKGDVFNK